jgi:hypothetical protein
MAVVNFKPLLDLAELTAPNFFYLPNIPTVDIFVQQKLSKSSASLIIFYRSENSVIGI